MEELVAVIKAWPVIVQGALGSALFWLILLAGQRAAGSISKKYSKVSKRTRTDWLINEKAKCFAKMSKSHTEFSTFATIMLYRASRHLVKALMWLALGLLAESVVVQLGIIGFMGCIYYLFKAYAVVAPVNDESYNEDRLREIDAELKRLKT